MKRRRVSNITIVSLHYGLFPFKAQSALTLPVSSYHKQTHIASLPDPLITTLLSCCLSYVRLRNTSSVWVIFHNLGSPQTGIATESPMSSTNILKQVWKSQKQIKQKPLALKTNDASCHDWYNFNHPLSFHIKTFLSFFFYFCYKVQ